MAEEAEKKPIRFGNHVVKLLEKIGNIPKSGREVFLWDLIRLAYGGLYKYRCKCLDKRKINDTEEEEDSDFFIKIEADKVNQTLSITHKGIGLEKDVLMDGIGCVDKDFVNNNLDTIDKYLMNGDPNAYYSAELDSEFSLGFYSAFLVADRVKITTKEVLPSMERLRARTEVNYAKKPRYQYVWDASASDGFFRIYRDDPEADRLKRGTKVTLYLKNEYFEYLDETKLRELVDDKYTFDVCPYPIYVSAADDHEREKKRRRCTKDKDREEDLESLKKDFEPIREIAEEALKCCVEKVVVNDRVFDLPGYLSNDGKTFVINPRDHSMKSLLVDFNKNPDTQKKNVWATFKLNFQLFSPMDYYKDKIAGYKARYADDVANGRVY